jgi:hypothetical protein
MSVQRTEMRAVLDEHDPVPAGEMPLDPGIRRYVLTLRSEGIDTRQSCEGGPGHPCPEPTVSFVGNAYAGFMAFAIAMTHGLPVAELRHSYRVIDGRLDGPWWEMTFRTTDPLVTNYRRAQCEQSG